MDVRQSGGQAVSPEAEKSNHDEDEYFGILRVVSARETVGNLSDEYLLDQDVVTLGRIGRRNKCDIQIDDAFLSQKHLELTFDGKNWHAQDLGSSNGTLVNGQPIGKKKLKNRDEITMGGVVFELEV